MKTTETLKLTVEKALQAYKDGTQEQKAFLIKLYGKEHFLLDIKDRVINYPSACEELGEEELCLSDFNFLPERDRKRAFAKHQLSTVTKALCEDWIADFKDHSTYKYYNYLWYDKSFCFSSSVYFFYVSSIVPSDLCFPTEQLAKYAYSIMKDQYITYYF